MPPLLQHSLPHSIPIFFSCDNTFLPYCLVAIQSIIAHASKEHNYDIILLHSRISNANILALNKHFERLENVRVRFCNVEEYFAPYALKTHSLRISVETYYRFIIPYISDFEKVIYLDADVLCLRDIATLYATPLEGKTLASCRDTDGLGYYASQAERKDYYHKTLQLAEPFNYFCPGVLLIDTKQFASQYSFDFLMQEVLAKDYTWHDQDLLNVLFNKDCLLLAQNWEYMADSGVIEFLPKALAQEWQQAQQDPYIIHFARKESKPWHNIEAEYAGLFFEFARNTLFYERILFAMKKEAKYEKTLMAIKKTKLYHLAKKIYTRLRNI